MDILAYIRSLGVRPRTYHMGRDWADIYRTRSWVSAPHSSWSTRKGWEGSPGRIRNWGCSHCICRNCMAQVWGNRESIRNYQVCHRTSPNSRTAADSSAGRGTNRFGRRNSLNTDTWKAGTEVRSRSLTGGLRSSRRSCMCFRKAGKDRPLAYRRIAQNIGR